jgi:class 3 adenylate cyclase
MVFYLLENIYSVFDKLADTFKVFKVETIGDCCKCRSSSLFVRLTAISYHALLFTGLDVAVCGLPDPNERHAVVMVKFANSCRQQFDSLVSEMVTQLGPDTRDLRLRIGLHSGPVTAGVLRGQKSRFQLFGDTVNTASRMESNGVPSKIHISQETASILIDLGKAHWISPRDAMVQAKGKGTIQTFWAEPTQKGSSAEGTSISNSADTDSNTDQVALIDWAADIICGLTKQLIAHHARPEGAASAARDALSKYPLRTVIDEFEEAMEIAPHLPVQPATSIELSSVVKKEIHQFVTDISHSYRGTCMNFDPVLQNVPHSHNCILFFITSESFPQF